MHSSWIRWYNKLILLMSKNLMFEVRAVNRVELLELIVVERNCPNKSPVMVFKSGVSSFASKFPFNLMLTSLPREKSSLDGNLFDIGCSTRLVCQSTIRFATWVHRFFLQLKFAQLNFVIVFGSAQCVSIRLITGWLVIGTKSTWDLSQLVVWVW